MKCLVRENLYIRRVTCGCFNTNPLTEDGDYNLDMDVSKQTRKQTSTQAPRSALSENSHLFVVLRPCWSGDERDPADTCATIPRRGSVPTNHQDMRQLIRCFARSMRTRVYAALRHFFIAGVRHGRMQAARNRGRKLGT